VDTTLDGKIALVTGAGSGIGRTSALALAKAGATVVVSDIAEDAGRETAGLIGGSARFIRADVSDHASTGALIDQIVSQFGRLDIAHNNAGIVGTLAPLAELSFTDWQKVISVNLGGVFNSLHFELPVMARQGSGAIVNTRAQRHPSTASSA
jgi:NAD(P)-dependent dehydrogenase (short-subunit alcohol dehydrogenase family)